MLYCIQVCWYFENLFIYMYIYIKIFCISKLYLLLYELIDQNLSIMILSMRRFWHVIMYKWSLPLNSYIWLGGRSRKFKREIRPLKIVVHRSLETLTNQSAVIIRSDDRFLNLVVDSDSIVSKRYMLNFVLWLFFCFLFFFCLHTDKNIAVYISQLVFLPSYWQTSGSFVHAYFWHSVNTHIWAHTFQVSLGLHFYLCKRYNTAIHDLGNTKSLTSLGHFPVSLESHISIS